MVVTGTTVIGVAALLGMRIEEAEVEDARTTIAAHLLEDFRRLRRNWDAVAREVQFGIELSGTLERGRWREGLDALMRSETAGLHRASIVVVADGRGGVLFSFGDGADRIPVGAVLADASPWLYLAAEPALFYVVRTPMRLGEGGTGTLVSLMALDRGVLVDVGWPNADVFVLWEGRSLASSLGLGEGYQLDRARGRDGAEGRRVLEVSVPLRVPGDAGPSPAFLVRAPLHRTLSLTWQATLVGGALGLLGLVLFPLLGTWLARLVGRIDEMGERAVRFARDRVALGLTPAAGSTGKGRGSGDELSSLEASLADLMAAVGESERRFQDVVALSGEYVWEFDARGKLSYVSERVSEVIGYSVGEVLGKSPLEFSPPAEAERLRGVVGAIVAERRPFRGLEQIYVRKDGSLRWLSVSGGPIVEGGELRGYRGTAADVTEQKQAKEMLAASLREKETLLREIHHRVKNNLQILGSLLYFQERRTSDPEGRRALEEMRNRLMAMHLVHEILYSSQSLARVDFGRYLRALAEQIEDSFGSRRDGQRVRVEVEAGSVSLPVEQALPCGMLVTELLLNAFKYAFPDRAGRVTVTAEAAEGRIRLQVADDGVGLPAEADPSRPSSFGLTLVANLVRQLGGAARWERAPGTRVSVEFPLAS